MATIKTTTKKPVEKAIKKTVTKNTIKKAPKKATSFAVIETGGKQYLVEPGMKLKVEKLKMPEQGTAVKFDKVLLIGGGKSVKIGQPYIKEAVVTAERLEEGKTKKVTVFKYHSKTRYSKKKGHRQPYTMVEIKDIK